jgi:galactokinase
VGSAPGRVTLVGEHVDYVGGRVACLAVDLAVAAAIRPSADGRWRAVSRGRRVERQEPAMAGDVGDRLFAAAVALGRLGVSVPALEIGVSADLPESAGLGSSTAVTLAALVAMLRLAGARVDADGLVFLALTAERDIVGVPCGDLDQRAAVHGEAGTVVLLDCAGSRRLVVAWPWSGIQVLVATSGESHDVGGEGYRLRRQSAERACAVLGVTGCQEIGDRWCELPEELRRRGRHIATETRRTNAAAQALRAGDAPALGRLLDESHASLRDDCEVSTERLDAMVIAARKVPGCHGARLVGAGFGGSAIALVEREAMEDCAAAMTGVSRVPGGTWVVRSADGLVVTAADVVAPR